MTFDNALAGNNRLIKTLIPAVVLIILVFLSIRFLDKNSPLAAFILIAVVCLILILLIRNGYKNYDIFYDNSSMYLKGSGDDLQTISFLKVKKVALTLDNFKVMGFRFYQYKIEYVGEDGVAEISFWTLDLSSEIDKFESYVKKLNRELVVKHVAIS